ncbi:alpha/beta hydrolase [Nocardioides solisilvae]|uniref:alpha/beta hydrolase n=1 Tax=Nocardioides solisilvae TaxID=1542435 RepID=UPI000D747497|nr:alpha/beta hydrolase [Nocardioides solisilvae]
MNRVVAALLALALVLGSVVAGAVLLLGDDDGGGDGARGGETTTRTPERQVRSDDEPAGDATEPPDPALEQYYSQEVDWQSCGDGFECGWLKVPMDYDEPDGEKLDLALLKVLADAPERRVGSLVVNPGGPGAPGTEYAAQAAFVFREPLLDHFDIIGFDPRGTGRSNPVDCLSDEQLDEYLAGDPAPDTPAEVREAVRWSKRFGAGCQQRSGDLVDHVSTVEAARDMDVLRAALGEGQLDYLGASYGTKLGATYAELFPERVGHLVLDGAVDLQLDSRGMSLGQARGFETAITAYVENCVDGGDCFLGDSVDDGLATITRLLDEVDADPLPAGDRELRIGNAFYGIVAPLYNRDYWRLLDRALRQALDGNGAALLELSDFYASRGPDGSYSDNSSEAIYAINCLDDPSFTPASEVPAEFEAFEEASPTFGRVFAWGLVGCQGFRGEPSEPIEVDGSGAAPILVTGTTRDPATPYEWAESLADQLESGILLTRDGDGHTAYNAGDECIDVAIEDYLVDGVVPDGDVTC